MTAPGGGLSRRGVVAGLLSMAGAAGRASAQTARAVDLLGREIVLSAPARRVILAQGRELPALGLIMPNPVAALVGLGGEFERQDAETYALYKQKFPELAEVAIVGAGAPGSFSVEKAISLKPDLAILSRSVAGAGPSGDPGALARQLTEAGVPTAVLDFYANPIADMEPALRALGRLLGREGAAESYIAFYRSRLDGIAGRLKEAKAPEVSILLNTHAGGGECCFSSGKGGLDDFIRAAGGRSIAAGVIPGVAGHLDPEFVLSRNPSVYVGTGGTYQAKRGGLVLGAGVTQADARSSFASLLARPDLAALEAVKAGRAFGLWQLFNDTPAHIVAVELLAKWLHPELFADIDPGATLAEINARFAAVPMAGTYWIEAARP